MRRSGKGGQTKCLREKPSFALRKNTEKRPLWCYFAIIRKQCRRYTKSVHENRIKENIDIFDFSLTEEEKQELAARDKNEPIIGKPKRLDFTEVVMTWEITKRIARRYAKPRRQISESISGVNHNKIVEKIIVSNV